MVIGDTRLATITNQSDAKNEEPGTYLLPSLQFPTDTLVEAWELYAEKPGSIQLQVSLIQTLEKVWEKWKVDLI